MVAALLLRYSLSSERIKGKTWDSFHGRRRTGNLTEIALPEATYTIHDIEEDSESSWISCDMSLGNISAKFVLLEFKKCYYTRENASLQNDPRTCFRHHEWQVVIFACYMSPRHFPIILVFSVCKTRDFCRCYTVSLPHIRRYWLT